MSTLRQVMALVRKDITAEVRGRPIWLASGFFAGVVLVVFVFALDLRVENKAALGPGALWIAILFSGIIGIGRAFASESDYGRMDRLLICPVDRRAIFVAKLLGTMLFVSLVLVVLLPVFGVLFGLAVLRLDIIGVLLLGALGIATVTTLFSAGTTHSAAREILLPLIAFPLLLPVMIAAVKATEGIITPVVNDSPWVGLLIAYDVIFLSIGMLTFGQVVDE